MSADKSASHLRGRKTRLTRQQVIEIIQQRRSGDTLTQIAISLNAQKVSLPGDGLRWHKSSVDRVLRTKYARAIEADLPEDDESA